MQAEKQIYEDHMQKIINLFDKEAFEKEIKKKEKDTVFKLHKLMQNYTEEHFLKNFSDQAQKDLEKFIPEGKISSINYPIKNHIDGIGKCLQDYQEEINATIADFKQWMRTTKKKKEKFDIKVNIKEELDLLNSMYPYDTKRKAWKLPEFILSYNDIEDISFPGLYLNFNFNATDVNSAIKILGFSEVNYNNNNDYYHPHVSSSGSLCMGDGEAANQLFWEKKELFTLIHQQIISILSTYNPDSPYAKLETWTEKTMYCCRDCEQMIDEDHVFFIYDDEEQPSCEDCCVYIEDEGWRWKNHYTYSQYHERWIKKEDATPAWITNDKRFPIEKILADPDFKMCPGCNEFIHIDCFHDTNGVLKCIRCHDEEINIPAEQTFTATNTISTEAIF